MHTDSKLNTIMDSLITSASQFFTNDMSLEVTLQSNEFAYNITLNEYTAMIGIGGHFNVLFYLGCEDSVLNYVAKQFVNEELSDEEMRELKISAAGEVSNIIAGHAITPLANHSETINITPPAIVEHSKSMIHSKCQIRGAVLQSDIGLIRLFVLGSNCAEFSSLEYNDTITKEFP